jgi:hypothetical protein
MICLLGKSCKEAAEDEVNHIYALTLDESTTIQNISARYEPVFLNLKRVDITQGCRNIKCFKILAPEDKLQLEGLDNALVL